MRVILSAVLTATLACAQQQIPSQRAAPGSTQDWSAAGVTKPMRIGTTLPSTCTVGTQFYKSNATAGENLYACTSTNTWTAQGGSGGGGDVVGPASATDNAFARYDSTTGKLIQNSVVTADDSGNVTANSIALGGATSACDGTAGCTQYGQGTAPSGQGTTAIQYIAPASVTSYRRILPGTAASGVPLWTCVSVVCTETVGTVLAANGGTGQTTYTKGDLLVTPGSTTVSKLPIGTDGQVLTADAASTNGLKWATAGGGTSIYRLNADYVSGAQTVGASPATKQVTVQGRLDQADGSPFNRTYIGTAGTVTRLCVLHTDTQSGTGSLVATLFKNGSTASMAVTIAAGETSQNSCTTSSSFSVATGDYLYLDLANNASATSTSLAHTFVEITP